MQGKKAGGGGKSCALLPTIPPSHTYILNMLEDVRGRKRRRSASSAAAWCIAVV
jgi:hypothetical protein